MENTIMFRNNKTNEWLHSNCESDKNIIKEVMINKSNIIIKNRKRDDQLYKEKAKIIEDNIQVKHEQDQRKNNKENLFRCQLIRMVFGTQEEIEKQVDKTQTKKNKIQQLSFKNNSVVLRVEYVRLSHFRVPSLCNLKL